MINTLNEQMQYHYNQRIFVNEMLEMCLCSVKQEFKELDHFIFSAIRQLLALPAL
ncbi:unnamed protein product [Ceratitis capitata]|uniref:(Mediterranean fruit fly) hypothetical protein n=1 Tax=Ceratitis capitata TaxID=7213 RepID=A0A811UK83_CERCA|nr:unnamed protein product [Ceratitis capitata]